ncbi:MAG: LysR family transcriptional regulator [Pseudomonadota bacterium]
MINTRHLASLTAIAQHGSFAAAGAAIGRSHSAISLHIKALEEELGTRLVDRSVRPAVLTADGEALAAQAGRLQRVLDDIRSIGDSTDISGQLSIGIVPTVMSHLAPPALSLLNRRHPALRLDVRTGLSSELAYAVRSGDLDGAILTAPDLPPEDLVTHTIADEPLVVIAPGDRDAATDAELLQDQPFIWFSRKTWAGQQIERRLLDRRIRVRPSMEIDNLDAIVQLVRHGLGVAVVPDMGTDLEGLTRIPFCDPQMARRTVLMSRPGGPSARLLEALHLAFVETAGAP